MSELMVHLSIWQLLQLEVLFPEKIRGRERVKDRKEADENIQTDSTELCCRSNKMTFSKAMTPLV